MAWAVRWTIYSLVVLVNLKATAMGESAHDMKYLWGNFLADPGEKGPDGNRYPRELIQKLYSDGEFGGPPTSRRGRTLMPTLDPATVHQRLMRSYSSANTPNSGHAGREVSSNSVSQNLVIGGVTADVRMSSLSDDKKTPTIEPASGTPCPSSVPARLCATKYNTTAPMYGVSLTSGQPVTIVQKFPDLLQQVIFEVCQSDTCDVIHGSCVQTYVPYLFLVIPLGPVTLTGQDYVLVESGCVCQPKYGRVDGGPSPIDAINVGNHN